MNVESEEKEEEEEEEEEKQDLKARPRTHPEFTRKSERSLANSYLTIGTGFETTRRRIRTRKNVIDRDARGCGR